MAMRNLIERLRETGDPKDLEFADDISEMLRSRGEDIPLFPVATPVETGTVKTSSEIPTVSEEIYRRTCEEVRTTGYNFFVAIRPVSIKNLLEEDRQREPRRYGHVSNSETMRATVPPEMEVAISPNMFRIKDSNLLSTDGQKNRIREEEERWKRKLTRDVMPFVSMRMVDPSTISQLEDAFMDDRRQRGELLIPDYFVRTDVRTVPGYVAGVGRLDRTNQRIIGGWGFDVGSPRVFAVSVVVLPRKLAV